MDHAVFDESWYDQSLVIVRAIRCWAFRYQAVAPAVDTSLGQIMAVSTLMARLTAMYASPPSIHLYYLLKREVNVDDVGSGLEYIMVAYVQMIEGLKVVADPVRVSVHTPVLAAASGRQWDVLFVRSAFAVAQVTVV